MNHTKEPWIAEPDSAANHSHWHIRFPTEEYRSISIDGEKMAANAERIVSCVNACANIENPVEAIWVATEALKEIANCFYSQQDMSRCRGLAQKALALLGKEQE